MSTFWDVATKQLDESRAECRVKDRELEEMEERHQMEVKIYKQKVKHLLYEQENHLAGLKAENMVSISYLDIYSYNAYYVLVELELKSFYIQLSATSAAG